jgi:hypothetical protein
VETARSFWYKQKVYIYDLIAQLLAKTLKRKQRQSFDREKNFLNYNKSATIAIGHLEKPE